LGGGNKVLTFKMTIVSISFFFFFFFFVGLGRNSSF